MRRLFGVLVLACTCTLFLVLTGSSTAYPDTSPRIFKGAPSGSPAVSGFADFRDLNFGNGITECPQAGINTEPMPLDRREIDTVEQLSSGGDDRRTNTEYSCFPQNETSIDTNPKNRKNLVAGQNDYRNGVGSSGFDASVDGGRTWYDNIIPFPSTPAGPGNPGLVPSSGDPAVVFDRSGVVYYAQLGVSLANDDNGIFVSRSTNGGFTWSRACVARPTPSTTDPPDASVCGAVGDPRMPGDGAVHYQQDNDNTANFSVTFNDKEYIAGGPRPTGVTPRCFAPITKTPIPAGSPGCPNDIIGVDRLYVTWSSFDNPPGGPPGPQASRILISYSDDQARSWSPPMAISGSAPFCGFAFAGGNQCDDNQYSIPTVHPTTGLLGVSFTNNNTPLENQYLFVRSTDGGQTFAGPFFVTPIFDINFPRSGFTRPDCGNRGQQFFRVVYTNSCFRSNPGGNVVVDKRGGAFADDFYLVMSDNRNGTTPQSNADIFLFKSTDGGSSWVGPTRVNNDASVAAGDRDCMNPLLGITDPCPPGQVGNDQWWPWVDISKEGDLNVMFKDRRLDTNSVAHEWPGSRQRNGNYLVWTWGAQCRVTSSTTAAGTQCVAPGATVIPQPGGLFAPGPDPVPGQGASYLGPLRNFKVSDVPSNFDYSFRAGIFAGDYDVIAVGGGSGGGGDDDDDDDDNGESAYAHFTDARNGRSSGGPGGVAGGPPFPVSQPGRNPACEQSDVFIDIFDARNAGSGGSAGNITPFLVTLCPGDATDAGSDNDDDDDDD